MGKFSDHQAAVTRIGPDLAKNMFQVHGVDTEGNVVVERKLRRGAVLDAFRSIAALPDGVGGLPERTPLGTRGRRP